MKERFLFFIYLPSGWHRSSSGAIFTSVSNKPHIGTSIAKENPLGFMSGGFFFLVVHACLLPNIYYNKVAPFWHPNNGTEP